MKLSKLLSSAIFPVALAALSSHAFSATWYVANAGNDDTNFYFDADSIEKPPGLVLIWIKTVQTRKADDDGSWSSAYRWRINCTRRTIQTTAVSTYDRSGKFIKSFPGTAKESDIVPGSTGESVSKIACTPGFPKGREGVDYARVTDNDVFAATRRWVEQDDSRKDMAPQ